MTNQSNWQHLIAILGWQALMLSALIAGALWAKGNASETTVDYAPTQASALNIDCDQATKAKTRRAAVQLLDIALTR